MNNFINFIRSHGYEPKSDVIAGKWIRFGRKAAISARLYDDELGGYLHDWRTGEKFYWFADKDRMSPSEYARRKKESEALKQAQDAKRSIAYADASRTAEKLFNEALIASQDHAYLMRKKVKPYGIKQLNGELLIPVYSIQGDMQSIQFIDVDGNKKFLKGGKMSGGCHFIGEVSMDMPIYICEGYATAASVYEDTRQKDVSTMQMLMNLCFKAQNQSRATIDSLVRLKQPSNTQFIKQANIAQGHQQVNNLTEKNLTPQNELLKGSYAELDTGTTRTPAGIDTAVEALGKINGRKDAGRQEKVIKERLQNRQKSRGARVNQND